jgi:hypothetical protein
MKKVTPENWNPNDPEAMQKWMNKLPNVYDLNTALENDKKWELNLSLKNAKK